MSGRPAMMLTVGEMGGSPSLRGMGFSRASRKWRYRANIGGFTFDFDTEGKSRIARGSPLQIVFAGRNSDGNTFAG